MKSLQFSLPMNKQLQIREKLFRDTALLTGRTLAEIEAFCACNWEATLLVSPKDLAKQINEYEGIPVECNEDSASCDCAFHENLKAAEATHLPH